MNVNEIETVRAEEVVVRAGGRLLLDRVGLTLEAGRVHVIAGPNGAGKSTLLKALTGETSIEAGIVRLHGKPLDDWPSQELARKRACLPQSSSLSFPFTIREVVGIGRLPYRERRVETMAAVEGALEKVGLLDRANEGYLHLSGGEKQRVHLARVLAQLGTPAGQTLLLDEPTASLDLTYQQMVFGIAREWAQHGAAVLFVLHDLNQVARHAHQVTILCAGQTVATGKPTDVLTPRLIEQVYRVRSRWISDGDHRFLAVEPAP